MFMVVCVCNAIRENQVRDAARSGAITACQAYRALGRQPKCGQCVPFARAIIDAERAAA
jgi:bacterioferritin-associated ferredoxin